MIHPRIALAFLTLFPFALAGCSGSAAHPTGEPPAVATLNEPSARYAPRTDLIVLRIPDGAPTRWHTMGYPPTRSARLYPNTPDRDLALELRKQFGKNILD